jgi:hypothetical protein
MSVIGSFFSYYIIYVRTMLNLTISHHVFLTQEQRYSLHNGEDLVVIGVSVPVWYRNKKTSEPANEIFCKYRLKNPRKDVPIQILSDGYEIYIPMRPEKSPTELTDDEWRMLVQHNPKKLEQHYAAKVSGVSSKNLLDIKDGGSAHLSYREHNKVQINNELINIMHYVQIDDISILENSLCGASFAISEEHADSQGY